MDRPAGSGSLSIDAGLYRRDDGVGFGRGSREIAVTKTIEAAWGQVAVIERHGVAAVPNAAQSRRG
jgi:hypothetical protein